MRIIAGLAKGMPLTVPRTGVRPTADRIREAVFSSLGARVVGATALDLFAGTGALGLEAASRGAASVQFVENSRGTLQVLRRNIETFQKGRVVGAGLIVVHADALVQLKNFRTNGNTFSLIFADPPYGEIAQQLIAGMNLPSLLAKDGVFVLESAKRDVLAVTPPWKLLREAIYGDTRVSYLALA